MSINFDSQRWETIKHDTNAWWDGTLGRPLILARLSGRDAGRRRPRHPYHHFTSFYDMSIPPEEVIDSIDYWFCCNEYLGDGFPVFFPNFGPGVIAAYMGAELKNGDNTVWFHPVGSPELSQIRFEYIADNPWFRRTKDIISAGAERWQGIVEIAMTDLGGNMDILSTFRPSEKLLLDLYDSPELVKQLTWRAHDMWWKYFDELNAVTAATNPGYSTWAGFFSEKPHYMLQCDFCYMIGPDMFERFVKPELKATSDKLDNAFYHLDGPGELVHLDSLLDIESLKGIQWIPGAGQPPLEDWPEVHKKVTDAGKKIQLISHLSDKPYELLDRIADQTGRVDNIVYSLNDTIENRDKAEKLIEKFS
jgi:hypothetical protein